MSGPGVPAAGVPLAGPVQVTETAPVIEPISRHVLWGNQPWPPGETIGTPVDVAALEWGFARRLDEVLAYGSSGTYVVSQQDQAATHNIIVGPYMPVTRPLVGQALGSTQDRRPSVYIDGLPFGAADPQGWVPVPSNLNAGAQPIYDLRTGWGSSMAPIRLARYAFLRVRIVNPTTKTFASPGVVMLLGSTPDLGQVERARGAATSEQAGTRRRATAHVTQVASDSSPQVLTEFTPAELGFGELGEPSPMLGPRSLVWEACVRLLEGTQAFRYGDDLDPPQDSRRIGFSNETGDDVGARMVVAYLFGEQEVSISPDNLADGMTSPDDVVHGYFTPSALYASNSKHLLPGGAAYDLRVWTCDTSLTVSGLLWSPFVRLLAYPHPLGRSGPQDQGFQGGIRETTFEADSYTFGWSPRGLQKPLASVVADRWIDDGCMAVLPWPNWSYYGPGGRARDGTPWLPGTTP